MREGKDSVHVGRACEGVGILYVRTGDWVVRERGLEREGTGAGEGRARETSQGEKGES